VIKVICVERLEELNNLDKLINGEKHVVFDLSHLNLINSTFISFVHIHTQVIALLNPTPKVLVLLKLMGVDKLVPIISNIEDAYALISEEHKIA
jgi:anti-anti-sigma regulatory factor